MMTRNGTRRNKKKTHLLLMPRTFIVPFGFRVGGDDGADHTGLRLVGLIVGFRGGSHDDGSEVVRMRKSEKKQV